MISKEEIISITKKELNKTPIGYEYFEGIGAIIPIFKESDDPPSMGGGWVINTHTKKMSIMSLLEMCDYTGKTKVVMF